MSESQHGQALYSWFTIQFPQYVHLLHHSPNEGRRSLRYGANLKRQGMRTGWPDYTLALPSGDWHGLYIELKIPERRGKTMPAHQTEVLKKLSEMGYYASYAYGFDDARERILKYINTPSSVPAADFGKV